MSVLISILGFAKGHWAAISVSVVTLATGVAVGRASVRCPSPPPCPSCPEVHCAAAIVAPKCEELTRTVVRWRTQPAVVAGCPPEVVPEVETTQRGVASSGGATASGTATPPQAPTDAPKVSPVASQGPSVGAGAHWTVYAGAGISANANLAVLAGVDWNPFGWPVGIGVLVDVRPAALSQSAVGGTLSARW